MTLRCMMTISVLSALVAFGCSSKSTTPAEDLASEVQQARKQLADMKAHDVVVTPEKVAGLMDGFDTATMRFIEEVEEWGTGEVDPDYIRTQMPFVTAATVGSGSKSPTTASSAFDAPSCVSYRAFTWSSVTFSMRSSVSDFGLLRRR